MRDDHSIRQEPIKPLLCGQCYYRLGGEEYAFLEPSGVWIHHDCGLRLGTEEIQRRGLSLEKLNDDSNAYMNTNPQAVENSAVAGDRFRAGTNHYLQRQLLGANNSFVQGAFMQFQQTKRMSRKNALADQQTLQEVNRQREENRLDPIPDVRTMKRLPTMFSMLPEPGQPRESRGACFWVLVVIAFFVIGVPVLGTLAGFLDIMGY